MLDGVLCTVFAYLKFPTAGVLEVFGSRAENASVQLPARFRSQHDSFVTVFKLHDTFGEHYPLETCSAKQRLVDSRKDFLRKVDLPYTIAAFDCEVSVFARVEQSVMLVSVLWSPKSQGNVPGHCLGMLVLCDCFDTADEDGGHVQARGRVVLETEVGRSGLCGSRVFNSFILSHDRIREDDLESTLGFKSI